MNNDKDAIDIDAGTRQADVPAIADDNLIAIAESAETRITAMLKIKQLALKMTGPQDWTDQGGKPWPWASGSEKIGRLFGMSWRIDEPTLEREEGGHFNYTYKGYFTLGGVTIEAIGSRSSKDGFFKKYKGTGDDRTELPPSEIDKGDVKKSAYTNLLGNGIMRMLGMRNLSWADLATAGITKEEVAKVAYKEKGKARDDIKTEGAQTVTCAIADVRQTTKKKDGTVMKSPLFTIISADKKEYKTFSESLAKLANAAKVAGVQVTITYEESKYGLDLKTLVHCVPSAEEGERLPGEEG